VRPVVGCHEEMVGRVRLGSGSGIGAVDVRCEVTMDSWPSSF
jgi:hypothetical protein